MNGIVEVREDALDGLAAPEVADLGPSPPPGAVVSLPNDALELFEALLRWSNYKKSAYTYMNMQ